MNRSLRIVAWTLALASATSIACAAEKGARNRGEHAPRPESITPAPPQVAPGSSAETFHDATFGVTWLTNGNLAATQTFGVANINHSGSMDYLTAIAWVKAMNAHKYLGHTNWTLPTTPAVDKGCNSHKNNDFGFNCTLSGMGSLYTATLHLHWPSSAASISGNRVGPFKNFQPNFYWTTEKSETDKNGYGTFSFNNGVQGSNVDQNYFYVLPMIKGKLPGTPTANGKGLQVNPGGETVYDPVTDVTWPADANLAATEKFGVPAKDANGVPNFSPSGGMTHTAAGAWINAMNSGRGYLGHKDWELPPLSKPSAKGQCASGNVGGCAGNPLGELYYIQLHHRQGELVTPIPDTRIGAFHNIQPYLYWSCEGDAGQSTCSTRHPLPAEGFGASFNFGDGFQGSDIEKNMLYVMVYYPDPPPPPAPRCPPGVKCPKPY